MYETYIKSSAFNCNEHRENCCQTVVAPVVPGRVPDILRRDLGKVDLLSFICFLVDMVVCAYVG